MPANDDSALGEIAGGNRYCEDTKNSGGPKVITMPNANYDYGEAITKASILDQVIQDIRNGVVRVVPCEWPESRHREIGYALSLPSPCNQYEYAIKAAPEYEPLKGFIHE